VSLAPARVFEELSALGVESFAGVPCSQLDGLLRLASRDARYVAASSEGEAVAVAAGAWLGGQLGCVLMQNSGLGNAVNPLTSLACTFGLPLLLVVSHRGHDGQDAPQHELMGRITQPLLELLELPWRPLPAEPEAADETLAWAVTEALERSRPAALVVAPGTFAHDEPCDAPTSQHGADARAADPTPTESVEHTPTGSLPARMDALRALVDALPTDTLVVATTGMSSRELAHVEDRWSHFGMVGSMGCAPGLGLGLARARPGRRVVVVDGDGALLMKLGSLATVAHHAPANLTHVVLDNGCYESTGGQPCPTSRVDFVGLARAAGYAEARALPHAEALGNALRDTAAKGPRLLHLSIAGGRAGVGRVPRSPLQVRDAFRAEALA
jgi:phosphonopyruvate decarboxylase